MFTHEEIKTAETLKNEILNQDVPDVLKATYMAGEIMMDKDYRTHIKTLSKQCESVALSKYGTDTEGAIKWNLIKKMAFEEGVEWIVKEIKKLARNK